MPKNKSVEDLSVDELRWLLIEKRRSARQERLERFRRTGRVAVITPEVEADGLEKMHTGLLPEEEALEWTSGSRRKRLLDAFLLVVEISAVLGFIFVLFNGLSLMRELNREVASALVQPTLTPTPLIVAVVLPSGHIPPSSSGISKPNDAEIPEHLRPLVQSLANLPLPTPGPEQAVQIQIPAISVDDPIVQGDGWEQLKMGVGQHLGSAVPGKNGNLVLSAHNDIYGEIFKDLDKLQPGDRVEVFSTQKSYTYRVVDTKIVDPTDVSVMDNTSQPTLTLISCYPYMIDKKRIVVIARLQGEE